MRYGYARVSSKDQNPARQIDALRNLGVEERNIYTDYESGKDFERGQYRKMLSELIKGDVLVIKSIDRLGRNYEEILEQWRIITKKKGVSIEIIDIPQINHDSKTLIEVFLSDIMLQMQSFLAQNEREQIKKRQAEGIQAAKKRGIRFGRPCKPKTEKYFDLKKQWMDGKISAREAARQLEISHSTFLNWVNTKEMDEVMRIAKEYEIADMNHIKPGIGETTRVLLRRIPWRVLVSKEYIESDELGHIYQLAKERGVKIIPYDLKNYKCCGIIRKMSDV